MEERFCTEEEPPTNCNILSKMKRQENENNFCSVQKENIYLKKSLEHQINESTRLQLILQYLFSIVNHKKIDPPIDKAKMAGKYNELLNEKIAVLTHQLLNHSRYHTEVHKCFRKLSCIKSFKPSLVWPIIKDIREDTSINARPGKENDYIFKKVECFDEINQISVHNENGLDTVLEKICVIRLRRLVKQLMEQNLNLSSQADFSIKEADELKHLLMSLRREFDILSSELDREREKNINLQYLSKELSSIRQTQKVLLEELKDMQEERTALKCVNQKLLEELNNNAIDSEKNQVTTPKLDYDG